VKSAPGVFWLLVGGLLALAAPLVFGRGGVAGDYHLSGSLICSDCHTMHYSEAHTYTGTQVWTVPLAGGGPFPKLLRQPQSQLCLVCHDGQTTAPDVYADNAAGTFVRAAGGLNKVGDIGLYAEGNGHTLGSVNAPPGGTWTGNQTEGLQCKHCHDIHSNAYYRNLTPNPGTVTGKLVTYLTSVTYSGTAAVQQIANTPISTHYAASNIRYRQTQVGTTDFGLSEWCGGCHGNFHGAGGAANMGGSLTGDTNTGSPWLRHPTRDVTLANGVTNKHIDPNHWFSALASRVPVVSPSGTVPGTAGGSDNQVFCGSCHKAHGSTNPKGLIYDDETTAALEDGTSLLQTCQQCHYQ